MASRTGSLDQPKWLLGIDLGANSLGWAAFRIGADGEPCAMLHPPGEMAERPSMGVRIFDEGVENYGQGEREASRAVKRRRARLQRRQTMRRARRIRKTFGVLQEAGLLPLGGGGSLRRGSVERDEVIKVLDAEIAAALAPRVPEGVRDRLVELVPYAIRHHGLTMALRPTEFGRALIHLAQRRGFLSNRKTDAKDDERSKVKADIKRLDEGIRESGDRTTLGSYLYQAALRGERIRRRWTSRQMYRDEFEKLWSAQEAHLPGLLTKELKARLERAIFHQRPLKDQSELIGDCELENGSEYMDEHGEVRRTRRRRRAPECLLMSQRFRIRQALNNLRIRDGNQPERGLTPEEAERLAVELDRGPNVGTGGRCELGKNDIKRLLGFGRSSRVKLNIDTAIKGNRTNAQLREIFGDRWGALDSEQQESVVMAIWGATDNPTMIKSATEHRGVWALLRPTRGEAEALDDLVISGDYMSLSRAAMRKLVSVLETPVDGGLVAYATAVEKVYGRRVDAEPQDRLPPVHEQFPSLRNPAVMRSLSELRRVVNALVAIYGKPETIRVELARDLKRGREERKKLQDSMQKNERAREKARERILAETPLTNPGPEDILRLKLWEECGCVCPYSGRSIPIGQLFSGQVDIEHIIPFSRCLDDSFLNKTLCFADVNRTEKRNRTPYEAFGHDIRRWDEMAQRVTRCVQEGRMPEAKLRRFLLTPDDPERLLEGFRSSQLNDTRHASVKAREFLCTLYGGHLAKGLDPTGKVRVQVGNGSITALLRSVLHINRTLETATNNKRDDHRHHAIDAVTIALTSPAIMKKLGDRADEAWEQRRRRLGGLPPPWDGFESDIRDCAERVMISFRVDNRVSGPLHAETIYSPRRSGSGAKEADGEYTHIRKAVELLSRRDVDDIVDERVRETVRAFLGDREARQVCVVGNAETYPKLARRDGSPAIPILRVRVRRRNTTRTTGSGHRTREVENARNHHLVLKTTTSARGQPRIAFELVSMFDAYRRKAAREPVVRRDPETLFTLRANDVVELREGEAPPYLCRVLSITESEFEGCDPRDARDSATKRKEGGRIRVRPGSLESRLQCRKLIVSPIGIARPCRA